MNGQHARSRQRTKLLIGVVALAQAGVLVLFSATPTLRCTLRPERGDGIDCQVTARVLNLVPVVDARATGVCSVAMVASATDRSDTPPRLMFRTESGGEDLGYFSQLFAANWRALDAFARNPSTPELRLTRPLTFRTIAAHLTAVVLLLLGASMIVSGLRRSP